MDKPVCYYGIWFGAVVGAILLAGCSSTSSKRADGNRVAQPGTGQNAVVQKPGVLTPTKIIASKTPPVVTLAEYNKLTAGLSYDAAAKIIGTPGRKSLRRWPDAPHKVMYLWTNANNSNMYAIFDRGKLVDKTQFGLS